jgi:hypothetical protein
MTDEMKNLIKSAMVAGIASAVGEGIVSAALNPAAAAVPSAVMPTPVTTPAEISASPAPAASAPDISAPATSTETIATSVPETGATSLTEPNVAANTEMDATNTANNTKQPVVQQETVPSDASTLKSVDVRTPIQQPDFTKTDAEIQGVIDEYFEKHPNATELPPQLQQSVDSYYKEREDAISAYNNVQPQLDSAKQEADAKVAAAQQEADEYLANRKKQIKAWQEKDAAETLKKKEAGWTKEDFLRERAEQGPPSFDPQKVESHTVEEYRAMKESNIDKPSVLPKTATEIPHQVMQVAGNPIILADVEHGLDAQTLMKYAKEQGMDCVCQTSNGVIMFSGNSPTMRNVASDISQSSMGKTVPMPDNLQVTVMHGASPQALFSVFAKQYEAHAIASREVQTQDTSMITQDMNAPADTHDTHDVYDTDDLDL